MSGLTNQWLPVSESASTLGLPSRSAYPVDLFPPEHPLHALKAPTLATLRQPIAKYDLSYVFYTDKYDPSRGGIRPSWSNQHGAGADLDLPTAPAYLLTPGKNKMFIEVDTDQTIIRHMEEIGILSRDSTILIKSFISQHIPKNPKQTKNLNNITLNSNKTPK